MRWSKASSGAGGSPTTFPSASVYTPCPPYPQIPEGGTAQTALHRSRELAQHAEQLGFRRFWLAEHHNFPGIASAATAVVIGHIAGGTSRIRVGAGGIMLPNHAPLVIAEQFGTLEALHPGRIDLGLGRAPGSDQQTFRAMRRDLAEVPRGEWDERMVRDCMVPRSEVPVLDEDGSLVDALVELSDGLGRGLVLDPDNRLVGLLSMTDLLRALELGGLRRRT